MYLLRKYFPRTEDAYKEVHKLCIAKAAVKEGMEERRVTRKKLLFISYLPSLVATIICEF